jgi:hypothetical protein
MGQPDYEAELIAVAKPFWDAEAEITRKFFAGKPSREHYLRYLKAAVYKELNPVIGYGATTGYANGLHMEFDTLVGRFKGLDREVARRDMLARLEMMTEEFEHYVVLAEVLEFVLGRALTPEDPEQLPEDRKLNDMRRGYVESGDAGVVAVMGLTEGGGSSTFREASKLTGGEIEERLAAAMTVINRDEENHYLDAASAAADAVRSGGDLGRMKRALLEVSIQRVRMRNEMFSEPMMDAEIDRLVADNQL